MAREKNFEKVYKQGIFNTTSICIDKLTGIKYMFIEAGYAGGLCPLLDKDGKPVIDYSYKNNEL